MYRQKQSKAKVLEKKEEKIKVLTLHSKAIAARICFPIRDEPIQTRKKNPV